MTRPGLFAVTCGIYQIRGLDLSNMTLVEGSSGVIVIDPLISAECAAAGLALYRKNRGDRPVTAVIYTHSHADHFGGVQGVLPDGAGDVPILAPAGFLEHAVSENVYAGVAMNRRAAYMYGANLDRSPTGQVSTGLGIATSAGAVGLIAPTVDITHTGQEETIDGVRIVFQLTPGTEAPAEMNFHFPAHRALCMAENAHANLTAHPARRNCSGGWPGTPGTGRAHRRPGRAGQPVTVRFAAELLKHAVFADPDDRAARSALADVYERLGYGAENATWRSFYLSGTQELRRGVLPPAVGDLSAGMAGALTIGQWFDSVAIRVNGPRAAAAGSLVIDCQFTDAKTTVRLALSNGALIPTENPRSQASADLTLTLTKAQLPGVLAGHGLDGIEHTGDPAVLGRLTALLDTADPAFPIVTP